MNWLSQQTVVVPIDFSDESFRAVDTAISLAGEASHIHVIHVLPVLMVAEPGVVWEEVDDESRCEHARQALIKRLDSLKYAGVKPHVVVGDPGKEITDFAQRCEATLIVQPSHGRTGIKRLLIGSVAERVVRLAHCPVLVLK